MFTNAKHFAARLSAVEKSLILMASEDRLDWLFHNSHRAEFNLPENEAKCVFHQAVTIVGDEYTAKSNTAGF